MVMWLIIGYDPVRQGRWFGTVSGETIPTKKDMLAAYAFRPNENVEDVAKRIGFNLVNSDTWPVEWPEYDHEYGLLRKEMSTG